MATSGTRAAPSVPVWIEPIGWVGKCVIAIVAYLGGVAALLMSAAVSLVTFSRGDDQPGFWTVLKIELWWLLATGVPLVALVHVAMGSFLSMQAYFGSTFVDGTGAVVGVGLLRNLASLMTGMTLCGLVACRLVPGQLGQAHAASSGPGLECGPADRRELSAGSHGAAGQAEHETGPGDPGRQISHSGHLAAPRLVATALASLLLSLWGFLVGHAVGWQVAGSLMGLPSHVYFQMFYRMIWFRDIVGMIVKGIFFGVFTAAICCFEGLCVTRRAAATAAGAGEIRPQGGSGAGDLTGPVVRAACLSMIAILLMNMTWFLLVYHAVPVYGPSLLQPPPIP
jgi:phospholipid/cholesterol/gamma-HCH transport system permease protein